MQAGSQTVSMIVQCSRGVLLEVTLQPRACGGVVYVSCISSTGMLPCNTRSIKDIPERGAAVVAL